MLTHHHSIDPEALRERLVQEHLRLESLFHAVLTAFDADDSEGVTANWTLFNAQITAHMDAEERLLLPRLALENPEAAHALHDEHELIRSRLLELDVGVDLHLVRCNAARAFIDELRAHARHEDEMLYDWADRHLTAEERHVVSESLAPGAVVRSIRPSALGEQRV